MDAALDNISTFLRTQMDGTVAKEMAMKRVLRQEQREAAKAAGENPSAAGGTPAAPHIKLTPPATTTSNSFIAVQS